ncbi:MAG: bifunctional adenosylcobinamide kinase/adenosylcobinamide-phosphate guanylyltransferase [Spirochaetota bacterium]
MSYTLITGGASSGKSEFAMKMFEGRDDVSFIATGIKTDLEMEKKIQNHQRKRPKSWETLEEPIDLISAIKKINQNNGALIIDCLTFWISNLLYYSRTKSEKIIELAVETASFLKHQKKESFVVTNEVGMGIIPHSEEVRFFRKIAGEVNQIFAREADHVYFVISGIGMKLK